MSISINNDELEISGYGNTVEEAISDYKSQVVKEHSVVKQKVEKGITMVGYLAKLQKEIDSWRNA